MQESLILVPGTDGTGLAFYKQAPRLSGRFAVTVHRFRDSAGQISELIEDLRLVVDAASPEAPVTIVGESFGGALSLSFALAYPDRVCRLVIVNSFAHLDSPWRTWLGYQLTRVMPWSVMPLVRRVSTRYIHSRSTSAEEIRHFQRKMDTSTQEGYINRLNIMRRFDIRPTLPGLKPPVLFLAADEDHLVASVRQARLMERLVPRATVKILEGHGHVCLIAPNVDLAQIIDEWHPPSLEELRRAMP